MTKEESFKKELRELLIKHNANLTVDINRNFSDSEVTLDFDIEGSSVGNSLIGGNSEVVSFDIGAEDIV